MSILVFILLKYMMSAVWGFISKRIRYEVAPSLTVRFIHKIQLFLLYTNIPLN